MDKFILESFVAVAEQGSFSRAAEKLHITQPAISKRIANLENLLNTQLIDRMGKSAKLTHSGEVLFQHAKKLLESMEECKVAISNLKQQVSGKLNLGISHHIGLHRLPLTLKTFAKKYPQVEMDLHFIDSPEAHERIANGDLELAMATLSEIHDNHVCANVIWKDPLCFVVSSDHPLAKTNDHRTLRIDDLIDYPALLPKANDTTRSTVESIINQHALSIPHIIETNSLESIRMMTSIGLGWSTLPRTMLNSSLRGLSLNIKNPTRELGILYHDSRTLSNAAKAFLDVLKSCNP